MATNYSDEEASFVADRVIELVQVRRLHVSTPLHVYLVQAAPNIVHSSRNLYSPLEIITAVKEIIKLDPIFVNYIERYEFENQNLIRILGTNNVTDWELNDIIVNKMEKFPFYPLSSLIGTHGFPTVLVSTTLRGTLSNEPPTPAVHSAEFVDFTTAAFLVQNYIDTFAQPLETFNQT